VRRTSSSTAVGEDLTAFSHTPAGQSPPRIGVLALQGAFREHATLLRRLGADVREVRLPEHLDGLDGLVIPGGESTTMGKLMDTFALTGPLRSFAAKHPVFGTCAGLIMLASRTVEGAQTLLGLMDVTIRRNAFGSQVHSFEAPVDLCLEGEDDRTVLTGVFIRAPWVEEHGPAVQVVATCDGHVVGVRQGHLLGVAFHPELTDDTRLHEYFLREVVTEARRSSRPPTFATGRTPE
jgi:pyridoxal 5'-phosphate synthase pdxT subunit